MDVRHRAAPSAGLRLAGLRLAEPTPAAELPVEIELACDVIDRLELHRRCLDEAVAGAYAELAALLVSHLADYPELQELIA
jgi:hypothetical protein